MPLRLKNPKKLPKDGFPFFESGRTFNGYFSFSYQCQEILQFRADNKLPGATLDQVAEDLNNATCNRDPSLCYDPQNAGGAGTANRIVQGCAGCGGQKA